MKAKRGYKRDKYIWDIKNWYKRYFSKRTCRKIKRLNKTNKWRNSEMSMNLCFDVKGSSAVVDFPFQTPTDLTYKVLEAKSNEERIEIIEKQLVEWEWEDEEINRIMDQIKALFSCDTLEISLI